jgi:hypothetical protein
MKVFAQLSFAAAACLMLAGCGDSRLRGTSVYSLFTTGQFCFACSSAEEVTKNNARGYPVPGIVILNASFMKCAGDMSNSTRREFIFFKDEFFGGLVASSYWQQQATSNSAVGFPMINSWPTKVIVVQVDHRGTVTNATLRAGNAAVAVDPADFGRPFTGLY